MQILCRSGGSEVVLALLHKCNFCSWFALVKVIMVEQKSLMLKESVYIFFFCFLCGLIIALAFILQSVSHKILFSSCFKKKDRPGEERQK